MKEQVPESERSKWKREYELLLSTVKNDPMTRLQAHTEYLDEYILRWLGFCRLETAAPQTLVDNSLFFVVEAASEVAGTDVVYLVEAKYAPIVQAWKNYQDSLVLLRKYPERVKTDAEISYRRFKAFVMLFKRSVEAETHPPDQKNE
jgi:hypothetical protein